MLALDQRQRHLEHTCTLSLIIARQTPCRRYLHRIYQSRIWRQYLTIDYTTGYATNVPLYTSTVSRKGGDDSEGQAKQHRQYRRYYNYRALSRQGVSG